MTASKFLIAMSLPVLLLALSGCASTKAGKDNDLQAQGLKNQISLLETQLQTKDSEIAGLKSELGTARSQDLAADASLTQMSSAGSLGPAMSSRGQVKSKRIRKPTIKQIQAALSNAGYYKGGIDGKMGKDTRSAIKKFQQANGLGSDGQVGKKTWKILGKYLYAKDGSL